MMISYPDFQKVEMRVGRIVAANPFPEARKPQIGPFMSDVLTLGVADNDGAVILLAPDSEVPLGGKVF